ncbi:MAG: hypothetical protein WBB74_06545 [Gaiellaceae bacterium]
MSVFIAWVLFPLVVVAVSLGQGLLIERIAGIRLPDPLLLPLGLAGIIASSQLTTYWDATARLTTPLVVVLAAAGIVLGLPRLRATSPDLWGLAAAVGVFSVFAAPVVLSGDATFAGYTVLGDTSIHFIGTDYLLKHGRDFSHLAPSSYEYSLRSYYGSASYPSGGPTAIGALRPLVGQDVAWIFQPFLACFAATLALSLYALVGGLVERRPVRALVAFTAAQPALVLAYALQGSIKEVGTAWSVPLMAALVPLARAAPPASRRHLLPLAVAGAAAIGIVGLAAVIWLGPFAVAALLIAVRRPARRYARGWLIAGGSLLVVLALLSYQALLGERGYLTVAQGTVTARNEFGNLLGPLHSAQMFGIWINGDYRLPPTGARHTATYVLIYVAAAAGVVGALWMLRRRAWTPLLFVGVSLLGWAYVTKRGSPWADAKALVIVSPAIMLAAMSGAAALFAYARRLGAVALAVAITGGVLASNALAYHNVSLAPRQRLGELGRIGQRIAGQGPTLYTEFEEFGKHFLREGDPEGSSEGWQRRLRPLRNGQFPQMGFSYDLDQFTLDYVRYYRTIVLRRSPSLSRPPATYRRTFVGRFYEVWQRPARPRQTILDHLPLGLGLDPAGRAPCTAVRELAALARRGHAQLAYIRRVPILAFVPSHTAYPPRWAVDPVDGSSLYTVSPGRVQSSVVARRPGEYEVWVQGSFSRGETVFVDGHRLGTTAGQLNGRGQYAHIGIVGLARGRHVITLIRAGGDLTPGNGALERLGPVIVEPRWVDFDRVHFLDPSRYRRLCGKWLDWVEAVRG